jgi:hypothetical protein
VISEGRREAIVDLEQVKVTPRPAGVESRWSRDRATRKLRVSSTSARAPLSSTCARCSCAPESGMAATGKTGHRILDKEGMQS